MSEATSGAPASAEGVASQTAAAIQKSELSVTELLEAGVHFGHQTRRWNPRMKPFLYGERNGVHIVDLDQTLPRFREALDFVREVVASGGKLSPEDREAFRQLSVRQFLDKPYQPDRLLTVAHDVMHPA